MSTRKKREVDQEIKEGLRKAFELENAIYEASGKAEDHVFSQEFEAKMQELLTVHKKKEKMRGTYRYVISAVAVFLVVFCVTATSVSSKASLPVVDILGWFSEHFEFAKGSSDEKLCFSESQISYIPEGFYLVDKSEGVAQIMYYYENSLGEYFHVRLMDDDASYYQDTEAEIKVFLSNYGYECFYSVRGKDRTCMWEDEKGHFYCLSGTLGEEEFFAVLDGIQMEK